MATTVVAATYGSLPEFDPDKETVKSYTSRAKIFFKANSIPAEIQPAVLLSCVGGTTYSLLESLLAPISLDEATLASIISALEEHFQPKPNIISQRFTFNHRDQKPTETLAEYLAALRKLAIDCNFGGTDTGARKKEALEEALRDRLVGGVRSTSTRRKLLSMKDLTFTDAYETAKSMEAAERRSAVQTRWQIQSTKCFRGTRQDEASSRRQAHLSTRTSSSHATVVGDTITYPLTVNFPMLPAIPVGRKATLRQLAAPVQNNHKLQGSDHKIEATTLIMWALRKPHLPKRIMSYTSFCWVVGLGERSLFATS